MLVMVPLYFKIFLEVLHVVGFIASLLPSSSGNVILFSVDG